MEFRNLTPFPGLAYQSLDAWNNRYHTVTLRQTLTISDDGALTYPDDQEPLVVADQYFGEMNQSSVKQESDLAPYKPKCDVLVVATAFAPRGRACRSFAVNLRISSPNGDRISPIAGTGEKRTPGRVILDKTLTITGARFWVRTRFSDWELTEPEPVHSLPLRYEHAYGGELRLPDKAGQRRALSEGLLPETVPLLRHSVSETNPVGKGYVEDWFVEADPFGPIEAPRIEDPRHPIRRLDVRYPPAGLGVIARPWLPRRNLCGTVDDAFAESDQWLPKDFDFGYWNCAHPDLQLEYLQGDEVVELTNLTRGGHLRCQLPGHRSVALVRYESGEIAPAPMQLDTLLIDTNEMRLTMVHRLLISIDPEIRVIEARLIAADQWQVALNLPPTEGIQLGR